MKKQPQSVSRFTLVCWQIVGGARRVFTIDAGTLQIAKNFAASRGFRFIQVFDNLGKCLDGAELPGSCSESEFKDYQARKLAREKRVRCTFCHDVFENEQKLADHRCDPRKGRLRRHRCVTCGKLLDGKLEIETHKCDPNRLARMEAGLKGAGSRSDGHAGPAMPEIGERLASDIRQSGWEDGDE